MSALGEAVDLSIDPIGSPVHHLRAEHDELAREIGQLQVVADDLGARPVEQLSTDVERALRLVRERIAPHIRGEYEHEAHLAFRDCRPVPSVAEVEEIERVAARLAEAGPLALEGGDVHALRAALFDLHVLLRVHFAGCC